VSFASADLEQSSSFSSSVSLLLSLSLSLSLPTCYLLLEGLVFRFCVVFYAPVFCFFWGAF
jgi:hypothetical protein